MRVNVYNEELTNDFEIVWTEPRPGVKYCGVRIYLKSAPELHYKPEDDDRSAVTFWVGSLQKAEEFVLAMRDVIRIVRTKENVSNAKITGDVFEF